MVDRAGVVRSGEGLSTLVADLVGRLGEPLDHSIAGFETENLLEVATGLALLASAREESRGAHFRTDHPVEREAWQRRQIVSRGADGHLELRRSPIDTAADVTGARQKIAAAG